MKPIKTWADKTRAEIERVFLGKTPAIDLLLAAVLCGGHVLLEDIPGTGKTILARALATAVGGKFARVQATPDLLPTDILGVSVFHPQEGTFKFRRGPILNNILLVDEINRATPRTQSALLEAMAEKQISVDGRAVPLPRPFLLVATENPIDFEGTFPLPEAQKDRFLLSLSLGYPHREIEKEIILNQRRSGHPVEDLNAVSGPEEIVALQEQIHQVHMDSEVLDYIVRIVEATRSHGSVRIGVSPRGTILFSQATQALAALRGRDFVTPDDVKDLALPVLRHRVILRPESLVRGAKPEEIVGDILGQVEVPMVKEA